MLVTIFGEQICEDFWESAYGKLQKTFSNLLESIACGKLWKQYLGHYFWKSVFVVVIFFWKQLL